MMEEKNSGTIHNSELDNTKQVETSVETVDVEMVMRGAEKIKSKYELLYEDILEANETNKA